jgi:hypothetical protein
MELLSLIHKNTTIDELLELCVELKCSTHLDNRFEDGSCLIHHAAHHGNLELVKFLISAGCDPNRWMFTPFEKLRVQEVAYFANEEEVLTYLFLN